MNKVGYIYHHDFLKHETGSGHPERPERLSSLMNHLLHSPVWHSLQHESVAPASPEQVALVHPAEYIRAIEQRCRRGDEVLDQGDTHVCTESFDVALLAVGAVLGGVDRVVGNELRSAFCAVRPPGHHAETATAMGFCLLNNIAVGARYAQQRHGLDRVAIVDWDVHHGNGTQEIFYRDPSVLYISLHQYPFYPGTGAESEQGIGEGKGSTVNCPMRAGSGEKEYLAAFRDTVLPALDRFKPELLMISAGFDAHKDDPLAGIVLTEGSFAQMTAMLMESADRHCGGRIVSVLEGGYDLRALSACVEMHLKELLK